MPTQIYSHINVDFAWFNIKGAHKCMHYKYKHIPTHDIFAKYYVKYITRWSNNPLYLHIWYFINWYWMRWEQCVYRVYNESSMNFYFTLILWCLIYFVFVLFIFFSVSFLKSSIGWVTIEMESLHIDPFYFFCIQKYVVSLIFALLSTFFYVSKYLNTHFTFQQKIYLHICHKFAYFCIARHTLSYTYMYKYLG